MLSMIGWLTRLVKFASHPTSNDEIKQFKERRNAPKEKIDKNAKHLKFSNDSESGWFVKNYMTLYSLKEHTA
jgi:hypothetical protein